MSAYITGYNVSAAQGKAVALEDSIMRKDSFVTAGSKMLQSFKALFDATVVTQLEAAGYVITGKTAMDEFGIEKLSDDACETISGAVESVKSKTADFALSNDISGKLSRQSAENGLYYIRPTYGTVSRFGLIPMISSMDQIGIVCNNPTDGFKLLSIIAGKDANDGAMYPEKHYDYTVKNDKIRLAVPENTLESASGTNRDAIGKLADKFERVTIKLDYYEFYKQVLYILASAEISNNISRYDGVKFGYRAPDIKNVNDLYIKSRSEAFGEDVKLMAILGSLVLSQEQYEPCYEKAMKMRSLIRDSLRFDKYDVMALPAKVAGSKYDQTALYAPAMLAGLPSITMPYNGAAVQLIAKAKGESALLAAWEVLHNEV